MDINTPDELFAILKKYGFRRVGLSTIDIYKEGAVEAILFDGLVDIRYKKGRKGPVVASGLKPMTAEDIEAELADLGLEEEKKRK